MIINHVNLKEDSPQKICEALAVCFVRVVRYQSVSIIGVRAPSYFHSQTRRQHHRWCRILFGKWCPGIGACFKHMNRTEKKNRPWPTSTITVQGRDFSWSFGSQKLLHFDPEFVHVRNAIKALVLGLDTVNHSPPRDARVGLWFTGLILVLAYDSILPTRPAQAFPKK